MKILVFGNICSGKTTIVNKLNEKYGFEIVSIDNYRRTYSNGSVDGEKIARDYFFNSIEEGKMQIIECLGVGDVADKVFEIIEHFKDYIICLVLLVPKEVCIKRLTNRKWDVPFPQEASRIFSLIDKTNLKIINREIETKWEKLPNVKLVVRENITSIQFETTLIFMDKTLRDYQTN